MSFEQNDYEKAQQCLQGTNGFLRAELAPQRGSTAGLPTIAIYFDSQESLNDALPTIAGLRLSSYETYVQDK